MTTSSTIEILQDPSELDGLGTHIKTTSVFKTSSTSPNTNTKTKSNTNSSVNLGRGKTKRHRH